MSIHPEVSVEQAAQLLTQGVQPMTRWQMVPLVAAVGRVLAQTLTARIPAPPFARSPLDGYAVRSQDIAEATAANPVILRVNQTIFAGQMPQMSVQSGQAARIMTGAPIPEGADCVIRQEDTDEGMELVQVYAEVPSGGNLCARGGDTQPGSVLLAGGQRLDWTHLALLASQGYARVPVLAKPRIAVLTTGDELTALGKPLPAGKIYNSNSAMLLGRLVSLGAEVIDGGVGADEPEHLAGQITELSSQCQMLITSGGVSVGLHDSMEQTAQRLGAQRLFHGVAAKPGTPTMAMQTQVPILCLSGNPFAAAVMMELLGRPAVEALCGSRWRARQISAILRGNFPKPSPVRRFLRGLLIGGEVFLAGQGQQSGSVSALAGCNALVEIPAGSAAMHNGTEVSVWPIG